MIRVVLDTNVFVSALLQPKGAPSQVFILALHGTVQLCVSGPIFAEYEEVIRRPRFSRTAQEIEGALQAVHDKAIWVKPSEKVTVCEDIDDNMFLECAVAAQAHYLVSGNLRHFPTSWKGTQVIAARQFLDITTEEKK